MSRSRRARNGATSLRPITRSPGSRCIGESWQRRRSWTRASWRCSKSRTPPSNSKRSKTRASSWARPSSIPTSSRSACTRFTRASRRSPEAKRKSRKSASASARKVASSNGKTQNRNHHQHHPRDPLWREGREVDPCDRRGPDRHERGAHRSARLSDALLRRAGDERLGAVEERGGQALAEESRRVRRLHLRHRGIQPQHPRGAQARSGLRVYRVEPQGRGLCRLRKRRGGAVDRATEAHVRGAADGPDAYRSAYPGRRFHGSFDAGQGPEGAFVPRAELEDHARRAAMVGERVDGRAVLPGLSEDGVLSFDGPDLLEEPLLEHLNFSQTLGAVRIHDEVRVSRGHAPGKKPNQPAGFQVRCDERCTRQGDTEARNGGRKQQRLVAVPLSLIGVAVVQADRLEPDGPRLPLIVKKRHFEEVAGCAREPATPKRRAAYRNKLLVIELDGSQPGPRAGAEPHCHVDLIACEIR